MNKKTEILNFLGSLNANFLTHPSVNSLVDMEMNIHKETFLKNLYVPAVAYIVAHKLTLLNIASSGASGLITKEKLGDQEIQYGNNSGASKDNTFNTFYYQEYKRLVSSLIGNFNA
jgi:hypothetical protein